MPVPVGPDESRQLHRLYRRQIRSVRLRWFSGGFTAGIITGILLILLASTFVVTEIPNIAENPSGDPDVAVVIGEGYLNREAANRLATGAGGSGTLALAAVTLDIQPGNRMDMQPTFTADLGFTTLRLSPQVKNQISVQDGKLVINMVGDPILGDLSLPLSFLPFDLDAEIRNAVDRVNNDVMIAEINQSLQSGFGGTDFIVEGVTTDNSGMTVRMRQP